MMEMTDIKDGIFFKNYFLKIYLHCNPVKTKQRETKLTNQYLHKSKLRFPITIICPNHTDVDRPAIESHFGADARNSNIRL